MKPIIVQAQTIGLDAFNGTDYEGEVALMALQNYGYLLKGPCELKRYSFAQFANAVEMHYDCDSTASPKNAEVVRVLRVLEQRNPATLVH